MDLARVNVKGLKMHKMFKNEFKLLAQLPDYLCRLLTCYSGFKLSNDFVTKIVSEDQRFCHSD